MASLVKHISYSGRGRKGKVVCVTSQAPSGRKDVYSWSRGGAVQREEGVNINNLRGRGAQPGRYRVCTQNLPWVTPRGEAGVNVRASRTHQLAKPKRNDLVCRHLYSPSCQACGSKPGHVGHAVALPHSGDAGSCEDGQQSIHSPRRPPRGAKVIFPSPSWFRKQTLGHYTQAVEESFIGLQ